MPRGFNIKKFVGQTLFLSRNDIYQLRYYPKGFRPFFLGLISWDCGLDYAIETAKDRTAIKAKAFYWAQNTRAMFSSGDVANDIKLQMLSHVIKDSEPQKMLKYYLLRNLQARESRALGPPDFYTLEELEKYSEDRHSTLLYAIADRLIQCYPISLGKKQEKILYSALSCLGKAKGISKQVMFAPADFVEKRRIVLPLDVCANHKFNEEESRRNLELDNYCDDKLRSVTFDVATKANDYLITVDHYLKQLEPLPKPIKAIFLQKIWIKQALIDIQRHQFDWHYILRYRYGGIPLTLRHLWYYYISKY